MPALDPPDLPALEARLCRGRWFASLAPAQRQALLGAARRRDLVAGQVLFRRGDANCGLYAVLSGRVQAGAAVGERRDALLGVLHPPLWFGELACLDGGPRTHDAQALDAVSLLHLPLAGWLALAAQEPLWWRDLGRLLGEKTRALFEAMEDLAHQPAAPRVARRLLALSSAHGMLADGAHELRIGINQDQLGALLSLTRQTVGEVLRGFEAAGWLRRGYGHIEILDPAGLASAGG